MLEEDRRRAEDTRREQENEYQRLMDEIARLQSEAQLKIGDLERLKQDMDAVAAQKQAREQEIMLERAKRTLESERRLEEERLTLMNSGMAPASSAPAFTASSAETANSQDLMSSLLPQMATKADSEKLEILIKQIQLLQDELNRLRLQMQVMNQATNATGTTATTTQPSATNPNAYTPPPRTASVTDARSAADTKYRVPYYAPDTDPKEYKIKNTTPVTVNPNVAGQPEGEERGVEQPKQELTHANYGRT